MWVLKPGMDEFDYRVQEQSIKDNQFVDLHVIRQKAKGDLRRLYLEYYEEVPGDPPGSEPKYPLRGSIEWKKV